MLETDQTFTSNISQLFINACKLQLLWYIFHKRRECVPVRACVSSVVCVVCQCHVCVCVSMCVCVCFFLFTWQTLKTRLISHEATYLGRQELGISDSGSRRHYSSSLRQSYSHWSIRVVAPGRVSRGNVSWSCFAFVVFDWLAVVFKVLSTMAESEAAPVLLRCLQDNFNKLRFDDEGVSTFTSVEQVSDRHLFQTPTSTTEIAMSLANITVLIVSSTTFFFLLSKACFSIPSQGFIQFSCLCVSTTSCRMLPKLLGFPEHK